MVPSIPVQVNNRNNSTPSMITEISALHINLYIKIDRKQFPNKTRVIPLKWLFKETIFLTADTLKQEMWKFGKWTVIKIKFNEESDECA